MLVAHELQSGAALPPELGAMYATVRLCGRRLRNKFGIILPSRPQHETRRSPCTRQVGDRLLG